MQFPEIQKNRHVWSFKNGIFIGKNFDSEKSDILTPHWRACFYTYESNEFKNLDQTIVSSKYFDQEFPDYTDTDWRDIPTPFFDSVLNYQKFNKDVCEWIFAMGGRLCFDVNEIDKWQCIPFLKGLRVQVNQLLLRKCSESSIAPKT